MNKHYLVFCLAFATFQSNLLLAQPPAKNNIPIPPKGITLEKDIPYRKGHDRWVLNVIRPGKKPTKPRAAIVLVHGGGWSGGDHYRFSRMGFMLAQEGYVVITPTYRMLNDSAFPACLHDVKNAIRWLRANATKYDVDTNRIGAYGNSAGGTLVLTAAITSKSDGLEGDGSFPEQSSALQAVACSGAVGDMTHEDHSRRAKFVYQALASGNKRNISASRVKKIMMQASPVTYVKNRMPPLLLIHGAQDKVVHIQSTDEFVKKAKSEGANIKYLRFEDGTHGVMGQKSRKTTPELLRFFDRYLRAPRKSDSEKTTR